MGTVAFGPVAFVANVEQFSPAFTLPAADVSIQATLDCAALAAGIHREAQIFCRRSSAGSRTTALDAQNDGNSNVINSASAAFVSGDVGKFVRGGNIPDGTTIVSVDTASTVTVSQSIVLGGTGYALTIGDPWVSLGAVTGITAGGADHDRHGNVIEWGVGPTDIPDVGLTGRQVRARALFGSSVSVSGHVTTA